MNVTDYDNENFTSLKKAAIISRHVAASTTPNKAQPRQTGGAGGEPSVRGSGVPGFDSRCLPPSGLSAPPVLYKERGEA